MAITLADFNKIWASTSPLTPYSFSESNYKQGWNFIGSTPPARQMWDFLQKNNDEKMQYLANNYLPLSGGTMTGTITTNAGGMLLGSGTDQQYWISSATPHDKGAEIFLNGVDRSNEGGVFQLLARDTNGGAKVFKGKPDGSLTWNGNDIALSKDVLPLSGGTMTGAIVREGLAVAGNSSNTKFIYFCGGSDANNGASFTLRGKGDSSGYFDISAHDGTNRKTLAGYANGNLTWNEEHVATTESLFTNVSFTVTGDVGADTWGDLIGTFTYPTGYTKIVGVLAIMLSSPSNMKLIGWEKSGNDGMRVRVHSVNALTGATARVDLMLAK